MDNSIHPHAFWLLLLGGGFSLATLFILFQKHLGGKPLLAYEPRRRVPWGIGATMIALYIVIMHLLAPLLDIQSETSSALDPANFAWQGWLNIGLILMLSTVVMGWLAVACQATRRDLGFPESGRQLIADIRVGVIGCLASLVPVFLLLQVAEWILPTETQHPLLKQLSQTPTPMIFLTAAGAALLAAPLFEELVFRLLLQGALERYEDQWLGYTATQRDQPALSDSIAPTLSDDTPLTEPTPRPDTESTQPIDLPPVDPPLNGPLPDLPYGWAPILASGLLFGLAHFGHGADPVPLFVFGIVLGYLYQRTHRLVPCITAHMLFNSFSLAIAWLQLR
jgi:hypothetical protein